MATTAAPDAKRLELSVSNFGPIAEGRVELRPFTVFVGPSNTGKSYLATLIYALHSIFDGYAGNHHHRLGLGQGNLRVYPSVPPGRALSENAIDFLYDWAGKISLHRDTIRKQNSDLYELPDTIASLVREVISGSTEYYSGVIGNEVARCLGVDGVERLIRIPGGSQAIFSLHCYTGDTTYNDNRIEYEIAIAKQGVNISTSLPNDITMRIALDDQMSRLWLSQAEYEDSSRDVFAHIFLASIASNANENIVGPLSKISHYIPTDRSSAMRSHQALTGALIASASRPATRTDLAQPTLSGVYGDFLERLVSLGGLPTKVAGSFNELADNMERNVLEGEIRIDSNPVGYPSFSYRPKKWDNDLPLMSASSMVSELASVVLYLRHLVSPGETLIIEEPELALHPAKQVELTRLLARAVKAGIRIIITTHSEWVLEEIANLVLMSELPVERRQGFDGADLALGPDEVGAWLFEQDEDVGGTVVKEMPLDKEMGNFPSGFGLVTAELYNRYTRISNRIEMLTEE